jgi:D-3-phosphoglycerate dehydrogenase
MPRVLVSDSLSRGGLEVLETAPGIEFDYKPGLSEEELASVIAAYDGLVIRSGSKVTARVIEAALKLRVIGRAGIGVDNVDVPAASRRGIVVMNTPTGNAVTTAEHALSLLFAVARKIGQADATMKQGKWEKKRLEGRELSGKTLGIIGLGNIGRIVADRAQGLRMHVIAFDPVVTAGRAAELGIELVTLDELFRRADAVTIHTPLTPETRNIVNDAAIEKMKKGVLLINAARGGVYDEEAVLRGLESGKVGGAGFDVFLKEPPGPTDLIRHPAVVATPHLGASTEEAQERVALEICEQVAAYLTTGTISNSVNVPSVPSEMASVLGPYTTLARRLGQFIGAVEQVNAKTILVACGGEAAALPIGPIVNAALAGLLAAFFDSPVNEVNAPVLARDRGIELRELRTPQAGAFASMLTITLTAADGQQAVVGGTLGSDRSPHLVRWGNCEMDASLAGPVLVMKNANRPGVIGTIGTILGESDINVSRMQMGLDARVGEAASVWSLDSALTPEALTRIRSARDVRLAFGVALR